MVREEEEKKLRVEKLYMITIYNYARSCWEMLE